MSLEKITTALQEHALEEISIARVDAERVGCSTPFVYPDFDSVTVWVRDGATPRVFEVTDYAEGFIRLAGSSGVSRSIGMATGMTPAAKRTAEKICSGLGLGYENGRVWAAAREWEIGEYVFLVARASEMIARIDERLDVPKEAEAGGEPQPSFPRVVANEFRDRRVDVVEDKPIKGESGRLYKAPLYLPQREVVVAPLPATPNDGVLGRAFMRFSDIGAVNGYKALSIIDDREQPPSEEATRLLLSFGPVAPWSRRAEWIGEYARN